MAIQVLMEQQVLLDLWVPLVQMVTQVHKDPRVSPEQPVLTV